MTKGQRVQVRRRYGDLPAGWTGSYVRSIQGARHTWFLLIPSGYTRRTIAVKEADVAR